MRVFISGIGGFIGRRVAERMLELDWKVTGIEKDAPKATQITNELKGIQVFVGDISKPEDCYDAIQNVDVVINTAAVVQESGDWSLFRAVNVEGAVNLARAAKRAGARQFVHLSSVMVYGFHYTSHITEEGLVSGDNNPYCQTKIESEVALKRLQEESFGLTIIRPGDVYGPGSVPWVIRPLEMMKAKQFILVDGGKGYFNYVYVDSLVDAIIATIKQSAFSTYNVTDGAVTNKEYFNALANLTGYKWLPSLPAYLLKPTVDWVAKGMRILGQDFRVNSEAIRYMQRPYPYNSNKIRSELGFRPSLSLEEGLRLTQEWLKQSRPDLLNT